MVSHGHGWSAEEALAASRAAVDVSRERGRTYDAADWLGTLADDPPESRRFPNAGPAFREALKAWYEMGNAAMLPWLKFGAKLELDLGRPTSCAAAAVAAKAIEEVGGELPDAVTGGGDPLEEARPLLADDEFARRGRGGAGFSRPGRRLRPRGGEMNLPSKVETVVVGAGQAGLTMSSFLRDAGRDHILLDRRATLGGGWQDRWDAFRLVSPNWTASFPGAPYDGSDPDGFMPRDEIAGGSPATRTRSERLSLLTRRSAG